MIRPYHGRPMSLTSRYLTCSSNKSGEVNRQPTCALQYQSMFILTGFFHHLEPETPDQ
ncbi:hypothetical protein NEUTE1DRAFT_117634 [Neurospora tetrasperma FGSC 2508]|uniref:Uncharacterized protein n=1 Tax=Neurospora tetrasperma (strain FGSC 2508 / ATCC MYA-4615 / P0657) TaxID=510951 RepID=F8MS16_NEUT8|nr:uncharacterized protein NEUTE1DRAFT_117634 [Neurospora tetrasperma FGSC 2508]EGO55010.1 hypothetical protein NEUTE1DRAFT_117634 [Neurospora tetrasperma FGSC 2508]EGZ69788.1 hypothetical protein NEUTE2DRAFT_145657 [Neurospora tetrasperma FGSC 2509]